jgi:ATP-dependent Clp protease adapter protein ClpS
MDLEGTAQVVLINDDVNSIEHVISCLMDVFGHGEQIATKIAIETHKEGQAIAEVEGKTEAILHKEQLISYGLTAEVQNI